MLFPAMNKRQKHIFFQIMVYYSIITPSKQIFVACTNVLYFVVWRISSTLGVCSIVGEWPGSSLGEGRLAYIFYPKKEIDE